MPQLLGFGSKLFTERKLNALSRRDLSALMARAGGRLAAARSPEDARPFEQIGLGRPLGVEIAYVYTGALGKSFFVRYDLMLASSVKRLPVFDAAPRAINALVKDVEPGFRFAHLAATQAGTPIVYYSPAMTDRGMAVTIEMVFDRFPEEAFNQIGSMFQASATLPVFAPANGFLMAGGLVMKVAARIAEKVIDGSAAFSETLSIDAERPGLGDTQPGFSILTNSSELGDWVDQGRLRSEPGKGLIDEETGKPYAGEAAYVILTLDGTERSDYASFAPTLASAAMLDRFLHTGDQRPTPTGTLLDALKAFNDVQFRAKAEGLLNRLRDLDPTSDEGTKVRELFEAMIKNISDESLRPKLPAPKP